MERVLSLLAAGILASTTLVAGAYAVAPDATTSAATAAAKTVQSAATSVTSAVTGTATSPTSTTSSKTTTTTTSSSNLTTASVTTTGNGAPSGTHFNLNIIGVPKDKTAAMDDNNGHRIFVQLVGGDSTGAIVGKDWNQVSKINKILLMPAPVGESFQVLDANATDSNGAAFQLPADVSTTWTVWARALGKPGGSADMTTCATVAVVDPLTGVVTNEVVCSLNTLTMTRTKNSKFQNVTTDLLWIQVPAGSDLATLCGTTNVPLFAGCLQNYFWNYDNHGLKLLQLRFYPSGTGSPT